MDLNNACANCVIVNAMFFSSRHKIYKNLQTYLSDIKFFLKNNLYIRHRPSSSTLTLVRESTKYGQYIQILEIIFVCGSRNISNKILANRLQVTVDRVKDLLDQLRQLGLIYHTECHVYGVYNDHYKKVFYYTVRTIYVKGTPADQFRECAKIVKGNEVYRSVLSDFYNDVLNYVDSSASYDDDSRIFLKNGIWCEESIVDGYYKKVPIGRTLNGLLQSKKHF